MGTLEIAPFFFLFCLLISNISSGPGTVVDDDDDCSGSMCNDNGSLIRFPFRLQTNQQPNYCGYPGFDLSCNNQKNPVLELPNSGQFLVREIDYVSEEIQIYDPFNCLPKRILHLNLSGSPFMGVYDQNYTFLSCPSELTRSRFKRIACLSNSTHSVIATSSMSLARIMSRTSCHLIATVSIPISWTVQYEKEFSSDLSDDLRLTWDEPDCGGCEARGGRCRFKSNASEELGCFDLPQRVSGLPKQSGNGLKTFKIISLATAIPALLSAIGVIWYLCFIYRDGGRNGGAQRSQPNRAGSVVPMQPTNVVSGLDEPTIESYTKMILGESRRLPGPNDGTCSICLSEYRPKETLRCIPECKHCFHADCIDEWLRVNATCPVCRKSPSPANPPP